MSKMDDIVPFIKEVIETKDFILPVYGTSMRPFLKSKDSVRLIKPQQLKKNDIILYQRNNGQYVLHRIIKKKKDGYVLLGDGQTSKEYPIYNNQIIAVVKSYFKKNKEYELKGMKYRLYLFFWKFLILRKIYFRLKGSENIE